MNAKMNKSNASKKGLVAICAAALLLAAPGNIIAEDAAPVLKKIRGRMYGVGSFRANIFIQRGDGAASTGKLSYRSGQVHVKFSNGKVLATNGQKLWMYNATRGITGVQDVGGSSGGVGALFGGMKGTATNTGSGYIVKLKSAGGRQVIVRADASGFLRRFQILNSSGNNILTVKLSNIQIGLGIPTSVFNFHPPSHSRTILNPLNHTR